MDIWAAIILRCRNVDGVQVAIGLARRDDLEVEVRAGENGLAGRATVEGDLMIGLGPIRGVAIDAGKRTYKSPAYYARLRR